jgi:dTDP-4-dehydrorhamnose reductase
MAIGRTRKQTKVARLARVSAHEFIRRIFALSAAKPARMRQDTSAINSATAPRPPTSHAH